MTYYNILGINPNATEEEIKTNYRNLLKAFHPDVYGGDRSFAEQKTREINEAYQILKDPIKRAEYDAYINYSSNTNYQETNKAENSNPGSQPIDREDVWGTFFDIYAKYSQDILTDDEIRNIFQINSENELKYLIEFSCASLFHLEQLLINRNFPKEEIEYIIKKIAQELDSFVSKNIHLPIIDLINAKLNYYRENYTLDGEDFFNIAKEIINNIFPADIVNNMPLQIGINNMLLSNLEIYAKFADSITISKQQNQHYYYINFDNPPNSCDTNVGTTEEPKSNKEPIYNNPPKEQKTTKGNEYQKPKREIIKNVFLSNVVGFLLGSISYVAVMFIVTLITGIIFYIPFVSFLLSWPATPKLWAITLINGSGIFAANYLSELICKPSKRGYKIGSILLFMCISFISVIATQSLYRKYGILSDVFWVNLITSITSFCILLNNFNTAFTSPIKKLLLNKKIQTGIVVFLCILGVVYPSLETLNLNQTTSNTSNQQSQTITKPTQNSSQGQSQSDKNDTLSENPTQSEDSKPPQPIPTMFPKEFDPLKENIVNKHNSICEEVAYLNHFSSSEELMIYFNIYKDYNSNMSSEDKLNLIINGLNCNSASELLEKSCQIMYLSNNLENYIDSRKNTEQEYLILLKEHSPNNQLSNKPNTVEYQYIYSSKGFLYHKISCRATANIKDEDVGIISEKLITDRRFICPACKDN